MKKISLPLSGADIENLRAGDKILLSGTMLTARDAAHKRICELLNTGTMPFSLNGETVYYAGPCPAKPGIPSNSCGPTTSSRVDGYTPLLLDSGLKGMIGKGDRGEEVKESIIKNGCVYFAAIGGCGALYGKCIVKSEVLAFPELLSEAVHRIEVKDFPVLVAIDRFGNKVY